MDENMETAAVTDEQVDAAWNETEEADQPAEVENLADEPENNQEQPKDDQDGGDKPADQPEMFTIKNRDETRSVTRDELISMAQKGWDYDHVRQERDQLRQYREQADPALELVKSYAQRNNMSVPDYLDFCRKHELMASGMTQQDAEQRIRFDKERAELDRQQAELNAFRQQQDSMKQRALEAQQARQRDIQSFYAAYPGVDPKSIPHEVWSAVQAGQTLTNAYTMHENKRLQAEIAAMKQNEKNKAKSPGSLGGNSGKEMDEIDRLWAEDD